jgi:hypothetical protein
MRRALIPYLVVFALAPLVNGCASQQGVVSLGENRFVLVRNEARSYPGRFTFRRELLKEASQHCARTGKSLNIVRAREIPERNIVVNYRWARIEFECIPADRIAPSSRPKNA